MSSELQLHLLLLLTLPKLRFYGSRTVWFLFFALLCHAASGAEAEVSWRPTSVFGSCWILTCRRYRWHVPAHAGPKLFSSTLIGFGFTQHDSLKWSFASQSCPHALHIQAFVPSQPLRWACRQFSYLWSRLHSLPLESPSSTLFSHRAAKRKGGREWVKWGSEGGKRYSVMHRGRGEAIQAVWLRFLIPHVLCTGTLGWRPCC